MAINNEPTIQPRTVTGIFTNYIAKVLPLAFDESMSYYECLCALLNYINDTIVPDINNTNDGLGELQGFYEELQSYVNNYFENLDVQEEINNKLDAMAEDGTLGNIINPYLETYKNELLETYTEFTNTVNGRLNEQDLQIQAITSDAPIVVTSTSAMTDTTKVYILTTDGYWYYYNGTAWTRGGQYLQVNALYGHGTMLNSSTAWATFSNDANNLTPNQVFIVNYATGVSNLPVTGFNGTILTYNYLSSSNVGNVQFAVNYDSTKKYIRIYWSNWTSWMEIANRSDIATDTNLHVQGYLNQLNSSTAWATFSNDANNLTRNRIYVITYNTGIDHLPYNSFTGTIIDLTYRPQTDLANTQIAINYDGSRMFYRINWQIAGVNTYSSWIEIALKSDIPVTIPNLYKTFLHVGIVGDSLASGESAYKDNGNVRYIDLYQHSWGQYMARASGNTYYNFSEGGLTTRSWLTSSYGLSLATDGNHDCECYICGLGVNDYNTLGQNYIGTINDINDADYNQNADSFYGNYGKIIQILKARSPKAKFFLVTIPNYGDLIAAYNTAITNIANHFDNVYLLNLNDVRDKYFNGLIYNSRRSGHYNAIAYEYMSEIIIDKINKYMYDNYSEFLQVEFINTNYEWTE